MDGVRGLGPEGLLVLALVHLLLRDQGAGGSQTVQGFFERIDALGESLAEDDERGQDILGALYEYAEHLGEATAG